MSDKAPPRPDAVVLLVDDKTRTTKYRPVSAAENRARLAAAGEKEPYDMRWHRNGKYVAGGRYVPKAKDRAYKADPVQKVKAKAQYARLKYNHPILIYINERKEAEQCKDRRHCRDEWLPASLLQSDHSTKYEKQFMIGSIIFRADGTAKTSKTDRLKSTVITLEDVMEEMDKTDTVCLPDHKKRTDRRSGRANYKTDEELRREEIERNR